MKFARILAALLALTVTLIGQTEQWKYISSTKERKVYYDPASLKRSGDNIARAWIKSVPVSEEELSSKVVYERMKKVAYS